MCRILLSILATVFYAYTAVAQHSITKDTLAANNYYSIADSLINESYFNEAIAYCEKAKLLYANNNLLEKAYNVEESTIECLWRIGDLDLAMNKANKLLNDVQRDLPKNHILEGRIYFTLGTIHSLRNETQSAIENIEQSLIIYNRNDSSKVINLISNAHLNLGAVYYRLGDYNVAQMHFLKSMEIDKIIYGKSHLFIADHYNNIGHINRSLGHYDIAMNNYNKGLSILKKINKDRLLIYSDILEGIGIVKILTGEYDKAKDYISQSLKHRIKIYSLSHPELNYNYNSLGLIFFKKNNYDSSLSYYKQALIEYKKYKKIPNSDIAPIYEGMALNYLSKDDYDSALYFQKLTISTLEKVQYKGVSTPRAFYVIGHIYQSKGDAELAIKHYIKSLDTYKYYFSDSIPHLAEPYIGLAKIEVKNNNYEQALTYLQKGLDCNIDITEKSQHSYLPKKKYNDELLYLEVLVNKAETLFSKFKSQRNNSDLLACIKTYSLCVEIYDGIYFSFKKNEDRLELQSLFSDVYNGNIASLQIGYEIFNDKSYLDKSFRLFEKSKANIIKNVLDNNYAKKFGGIPNDLLLTENSIKKELNFYQKGLYEERYKKNRGDSLKLDIYEKKVFGLSNQYDSLIEEMEKNYHSYFSLKYGTKVISVQEVQRQLLTENKVLIEYFMGDSNIYIFAITKSDYGVIQIKRNSLFDNQLKTLRNILHHPNLINHSKVNYQEYTSSAHSLYKYLIAPVESLIKGKELIIVPDGELALLPFEALLTSEVNNKEIDYHSLPYLIKKHTVSYANSATLLFNEMQNAKTAREKTNGKILAFAPRFENNLMAYNTPADTVRSKLGPLSWTNEEVNNLSSYFNSQVYLDSEATEKNFIREASKYNIIHIASHGLVDDENPMYSKIAFTLDHRDTLNDGYLHTFELYNTQLNAEMAVLSACNTGYGKVLKGEGVLNLARGFFYAGCKSVVMSLWVANDRSTATIMSDFYKYLADDKPKNIALRNAKLEYLDSNDGLKAHPYYWSQFVISGNTEPISNSSNLTKTLFLYLGGIFLLFVPFYFVRKKRLIIHTKVL